MTDALREALAAEVELAQTSAAFEAIEADLLGRLAATEPGQSAEREALYHQVHGLRAVRQKLTTMCAPAHIKRFTDTLAEAGISA